MASLNYGHMRRIASRVAEIATAPDAKNTVARVFTELTKGPLEDFNAAHDAMATAEASARKESREANEALAALNQPYAEARAVLFAYFPDASLPETLKVLPTDTDRKNAIERLLDAIDDHVGQPWADNLLSGDFGTKAGAVIQELNEAITASTALSAARDKRAAAYGVAYERYLAFKNVVRNAYGPKSPQYRRIHMRANGSTGDEAPPTVPEPVAVTGGSGGGGVGNG